LRLRDLSDSAVEENAEEYASSLDSSICRGSRKQTPTRNSRKSSPGWHHLVMMTTVRAKYGNRDERNWYLCIREFDIEKNKAGLCRLLNITKIQAAGNF